MVRSSVFSPWPTKMISPNLEKKNRGREIVTINDWTIFPPFFCGRLASFCFVVFFFFFWQYFLFFVLDLLVFFSFSFVFFLFIYIFCFALILRARPFFVLQYFLVRFVHVYRFFCYAFLLFILCGERERIENWCGHVFSPPGPPKLYLPNLEKI